MPELPEVETVVRELNRVLEGSPRLQGLELLRPDLRDPIPSKQIQVLMGERVRRVERRAKYILFIFPNATLISHLGMTGAWRKLQPREKPAPHSHDHLVLHFQKGLRLAFRDPRRFGILDFHPSVDFSSHRRLAFLGWEPLDPRLSEDEFFRLLRAGRSPIKTYLMNQKVLVGVGNIYASEVLFRSGIRPTRLASKVRRAEAAKLLIEIRKVLEEAIAAGGSTIRDYRSMNAVGEFQAKHFVYGHQGEMCRICHTEIRSQMMAGRNTFWCPSCQQ